MHRAGKVASAAGAALVALAFAATAAPALRALRLEPPGRNRATGRAITFFSPEAAFLRLECVFVLTLEAIQERVAKREPEPVAAVTNVEIRNCRNGTARILEAEPGQPTLLATPWRFVYKAFTGTLPTITSVELRVRALGLLIEMAGNVARCLYDQGFTAISMFASPNPVTTLTLDERGLIGLFRDLRGLFECPTWGSVRGAFTLERAIRLTLT
jgi:hypothetical protein